MRAGERLELELTPEQAQKMQAILRLRSARVLADTEPAPGRRLLLVEKE